MARVGRRTAVDDSDGDFVAEPELSEPSDQPKRRVSSRIKPRKVQESDFSLDDEPSTSTRKRHSKVWSQWNRCVRIFAHLFGFIDSQDPCAGEKATATTCGCATERRVDCHPGPQKGAASPRFRPNPRTAHKIHHEAESMA